MHLRTDLKIEDHFKMPSTTLKDQDKIAWGWTESTDPNSINNDNVKAAYRIKHNFCKNKSCRRNCRGNPFCLTGLGEARITENLQNPQEETYTLLQRRAAGRFVGLKNLGATCYVNSLLQLWFHNKAFRNAIFSWNPLEDPDEQNNSSLFSDGSFIPETVIGHLQQIFALMYYSNCCYIDPSPLLETLRLDTSTQQDAQEFSKLFISLLENKLRHQSLEHVQNLITDNFRGEYVYVTRCCKCLTESVSPSMFYELDLNVKGHQTLNECLAEFLQEEKLEGADCYSCAVCQTKQEACRFIKLCSLPPVLNLQLLRFVYDREKGQKKKLKTLIQFPEVLDMEAFVKTNSEEPLIYNLSAVLIHKGPRASSGHFVAYIRDALTGTWNAFNDESVEKLEGKKLKLEEDDSENGKKPKIPRLPKGCQSSTDAYMLVYTASNREVNMNEVKLSDRLQKYVDGHNKHFDDLCQEVVSSKKDILEKQEQLLKTFNCLPVDNAENLEDIDVISTDWIISWLDYKTDAVRPIDNTKLICVHGRLDPCNVTSAKYITSATADTLYDQYSGGPRLKMSGALCEACVKNTCNILRIKAKTLDESREVTILLKKRMGLDEPGFYVHKYCLKTWRTKVLNMVEGQSSSSKKITCKNEPSTNDDASEPMTEESIKSSQQSNLSVNIPEQTTKDGEKTEGRIICGRQKLQKPKYFSALQRRKHWASKSCVPVPLREIKQCYVICQKLQLRLSKDNDIDITGSSDVRLKEQCKQLSVRLRRLINIPNTLKVLNYKHNISRKRAKNLFKNDQNHKVEEKHDFEIIDDSSLPCDNSERFAVKLEDEEGNKSDDGADANKAFNEGIMCVHGNLTIDESERKVVPVRVWEIFKQYFPAAPSFRNDVQPCLQCQKLACKDEVVKQQYYDSALNQKKLLADFFNQRNRPDFSKTLGPVYVLSKEHFFQPWCTWIKTATRRDAPSLVDPPVSLKVDMLLCVHGKLHYSPEYDEDVSRMVLLSQEEWDHLTGLYVTDLQVTVSQGPNGSIITSPELCLSCFHIRIESEHKEKLNYDRARLNIRLVPSIASVASSEEQEFSEESTRKKPRFEESTSPVPPELKMMKSMLPTSSGDVRRSARNRKVPGQKDIHFLVSSTLTLRELKQKITGQFAVAPFDQHLSTMDGRELEGDYNTLSAFGILPNSTLLLQIDEAKESFDEMVEESLASAEPEAGFKGTGLLQAH